MDYQVEEVNPMFEECFAKAEKVVGKKGSELRGSRYNEFVVLYKKMFIEKKSLPLNIIIVQHRNTMK